MSGTWASDFAKTLLYGKRPPSPSSFEEVFAVDGKKPHLLLNSDKSLTRVPSLSLASFALVLFSVVGLLLRNGGSYESENAIVNYILRGGGRRITGGGKRSSGDGESKCEDASTSLDG